MLTLFGGLYLYYCRAGQAELSQQELGRVHLVLLDGRPRRGGELNLQVSRAYHSYVHAASISPFGKCRPVLCCCSGKETRCADLT